MNLQNIGGTVSEFLFEQLGSSSPTPPAEIHQEFVHIGKRENIIHFFASPLFHPTETPRERLG